MNQRDRRLAISLIGSTSVILDHMFFLDWRDHIQVHIVRPPFMREMISLRQPLKPPFFSSIGTFDLCSYYHPHDVIQLDSAVDILRRMIRASEIDPRRVFIISDLDSSILCVADTGLNRVISFVNPSDASVIVGRFALSFHARHA